MSTGVGCGAAVLSASRAQVVGSSLHLISLPLGPVFFCHTGLWILRAMGTKFLRCCVLLGCCFGLGLLPRVLKGGSRPLRAVNPPASHQVPPRELGEGSFRSALRKSPSKGRCGRVSGGQGHGQRARERASEGQPLGLDPFSLWREPLGALSPFLSFFFCFSFPLHSSPLVLLGLHLL